MLFTFVQTAMTKSVESATKMIPIYAIYQKMDAVNANYMDIFANITSGASTALADLRSDINGGIFNYGNNTVTAAYARLDTSVDPPELTSSGASASDGYLMVTVTPNAGISAPSITKVFTGAAN